jgi:hypothetical protein
MPKYWACRQDYVNVVHAQMSELLRRIFNVATWLRAAVTIFMEESFAAHGLRLPVRFRVDRLGIDAQGKFHGN